MRGLLGRMAGRMGLTIRRGPPNRFDAMEDVLRHLRAQEFSPAVVIDVGANVGAWTDLAARYFDAGEFHLVEPQPGCLQVLQRFRPPRYTIHPVALTAAGIDAVAIVGGGADSVGTGAGVVPLSGGGPTPVIAPATTLDALLGGRWTAGARVLLKLDVESHELSILQAGTRVLDEVEVIILEFQVFHFDGVIAALFADIVPFMHERGFILYDIASLASRPRDGRLRTGDAVFVKAGSALLRDARWA
ncbi:MAG: FkbM family methyltransferase [Vicinamibacterales bacterium]